MASSSAEQPPVEMDGDATKMMEIIVFSTNSVKPPPAAMNPLLLASSCSGSWQALSFLLERNDAPGRSDVMATRAFLQLLELDTNASSVKQQLASDEVEEGVDQPAFSPALLLEGVTVEGDTALHAVATNGDSDNFLKSADVIYGKAKHLLFAQNNNGDTPLHCAARAGKSKMVCRLIALARAEDEGGERLKELLRKENARKETALHEAVRIGNKDIVELLMGEDSELACFPRDGCSPLYQAILLEKGVIVETLYGKSNGNLSYSGPNGQNALHAAVLRGRALTKKLLEWNKDLTEQRDENGSTPLHFAAALQCLHQRRRGSALEADLWLLHSAAKYLPCAAALLHQSVCWQVLEANPVALYRSDNHGLFPIHIAASVGDTGAVAMFLEKWPSCGGLRDAKGRTFLHVAVEKRSMWIVSFVCRNQSLTWILNIQDNDGNTALHLAVKSENLLLFRLLFGSREVHLNLSNKKGQTPLDISQSKKPQGLYDTGNSQIDEALVYADARNGGCLWDHFQEKYTDQVKHGERGESKKLKEMTETYCIVSVLIATVTFGATFALPGGYRADDHPDGGTPTLAGRYGFDAFMMANALAFIHSTIATIAFMHSRSPLGDLRTRQIDFVVGSNLMRISVTCLIVAFTLGVYIMLAPVAHKTAVAICVVSPLVVVYYNMED